METATDLFSETNPFDSDLARSHSSYAAWRGGKLLPALDWSLRISAPAELAHDQFRAHVFDAAFPCVGAKAAMVNNCYRFGFYARMNSAASTAGLARDLWEFVRERPAISSDFSTFVASFAQPIPADEHQWEKLLWEQLQNLHELDRRHHAWDAAVSSDPEDSGFSFSFAETAFFVVGMHPASSRLARRFAYPTLVFNAHAQFERLRARAQFKRMQRVIRERDHNLQGSLNPNLTDYGEQSEARQYSGRAVEQNWQCPFRARPRDADESHS